MSILISKPLSLLKNSLSLAGNVNHRRDIIKPTLPSQFVKIAESADDSSAYLFGESLTEKMDRLQKESRIKYLLKDSKSTPKQSYGKRTYQTYQDSSNYQSSSKTQIGPTKGKVTKKSRHILRIRTNNSEDHSTSQNTELSSFLP